MIRLTERISQLRQSSRKEWGVFFPSSFLLLCCRFSVTSFFLTVLASSPLRRKAEIEVKCEYIRVLFILICLRMLCFYSCWQGREDEKHNDRMSVLLLFKLLVLKNKPVLVPVWRLQMCLRWEQENQAGQLCKESLCSDVLVWLWIFLLF